MTVRYFYTPSSTVSQSLSNIRSLNNTLTNLESVSAKNDANFQKWNQTLSAQLQELRDKIAKARHVAEGVAYTVFFPAYTLYIIQFSSYD